MSTIQTNSLRRIRLYPNGRGMLSAISLLGLCFALGGCGTNRVISSAPQLDDVDKRHPIALMEQPYVLDTFPSHLKGQLDQRTREQIAEYAQTYREVGHGGISILVPSNGPDAKNGSHSISAIRHEFARNGVSAPIAVTKYQVENPNLASPVRFAFDGIKAKVPHRCGDWPRDLSSGSSTQNWDNRPYWNFGCSYQNMIAAQTADPRDIAQPRGFGDPDNSMRTRAIGAIRKGQDPSINWKTQNSQIGNVGG